MARFRGEAARLGKRRRRLPEFKETDKEKEKVRGQIAGLEGRG